MDPIPHPAGLVAEAGKLDGYATAAFSVVNREGEIVEAFGAGEDYDLHGRVVRTLVTGSLPAGEAQPPKPRFDFYKLLPEQSIEVEVEPAEIERPRAADTASELYLLQAGSFRQREDAERRRAELLLLGLDPRIEETSGDNGRWHRVYVGPFDSRSQMAKARSLTAGQDIDTLLLKRGTP